MSTRLLARVHVLVVDADDATRKDVERVVADHGGTVTSVTSPDAASEVMATVRPTVVVCELRAGIRLIDRVRATPFEIIPVIATSAIAHDDAIASALPFSAFLPKPIDPHELCALILGAVARRGSFGD